MAKNLFFSVHYKDLAESRAKVVFNHWKKAPGNRICGYYEAQVWKNAQRQGNTALKALIDKGLKETSGTCLLIGSQTYLRPWVRYELFKSFKDGIPMIGVHLNAIQCQGQRGTQEPGPNPMEHLGVSFSESGSKATFWELIKGDWVEYNKIDETATHPVQVAKKYWGKGFILSDFHTTYDWVDDKGSQNFADWVG